MSNYTNLIHSLNSHKIIYKRNKYELLQQLIRLIELKQARKLEKRPREQNFATVWERMNKI